MIIPLLPARQSSRRRLWGIRSDFSLWAARNAAGDAS